MLTNCADDVVEEEGHQEDCGHRGMTPGVEFDDENDIGEYVCCRPVPAVLLHRPEELPVLQHVALPHQAAVVVHADPAAIPVPLMSTVGL